MRKTLKIALGTALILAAMAGVAQAQLIAGNNARTQLTDPDPAFAGPITTWDFLGPQPNNRVGLFYPQGSQLPTGSPNGRGLALGSLSGLIEVFYTELVGEDDHGIEGFGPTDFIRVVAFNAGSGAATDTRTLANPRPDAGIQGLTFHNGVLHALSGYPDKAPRVHRLNLLDGTPIGSAIDLTGSGAIPLPASNNNDGFAVLPNGNFLVNNGNTSCIYNEYDKTTGALVLTGERNIPAFRCTGVDSDGSSLYFLTEFNSITQTDFDGNMIGFNLIQATDNEDPPNELFTEDISLVHPVTIITEVGDGHFFFSRISSDDNSVKFDLRAELMKNGLPIGGGTLGCQNLPNQGSPKDFVVPIGLDDPSGVVIQSGDVISIKLSTQASTCSGPTRAQGIRFYYDSAGTPSNFPLLISPSPNPIKYYFHSDGTNCSSGGSVIESQNVTSRSLSTLVPTTPNTKCKHSDALPGGQVWEYFAVPTNGPPPITPAVWGTSPFP